MGHTGTYWGDGEMFSISEIMVTRVYVFIKTYSIYITFGKFTIYILYLNNKYIIMHLDELATGPWTQ